MPIEQKGGTDREKVQVRLSPEIALKLRIEKAETGDDMSDIVEEALTVVLPQRRLKRAEAIAS